VGTHHHLTAGLLITVAAAVFAVVVGWLSGVIVRFFARQQRYRSFLTQLNRYLPTTVDGAAAGGRDLPGAAQSRLRAAHVPLH